MVNSIPKQIEKLTLIIHFINVICPNKFHGTSQIVFLYQDFYVFNIVRNKWAISQDLKSFYFKIFFFLEFYQDGRPKKNFRNQ